MANQTKRPLLGSAHYTCVTFTAQAVLNKRLGFFFKLIKHDLKQQNQRKGQSINKNIAMLQHLLNTIQTNRRSKSAVSVTALLRDLEYERDVTILTTFSSPKTYL